MYFDNMKSLLCCFDFVHRSQSTRARGDSVKAKQALCREQLKNHATYVKRKRASKSIDDLAGNFSLCFS